ncbi:MAG TPA: 50S ribosomal protein L21 [bacterium]|mgnify:CR=1 FL=1|nr:50S ribosomal protein L21 [bacterium]HOL48201.1 50S ribosomal protein L21 [bacterium]HPQ19187.1 50S ribosomal protein L21 [bacterium]
MYAIVDILGNQMKVEEGETILVPYISDKNINDEIEFNKVLLYVDENNKKIGQPYLENAIVKGKIINYIKGKKVIVYKFKRRKRYERKLGFRPMYTSLKIEKISLN